jgi:Cu2+-exporting ATPase
VFDKTGTLTEDRLVPAALLRLDGRPADTLDDAGLQALAASLGKHSRHPLSRALAQNTTGEGKAAQALHWTDVAEQPGAGLQALNSTTDQVGQADLADLAGAWRLGSAAWCGLPGDASDAPARPAVWLARQDGLAWRPVARFEFDEVIRPDACVAVATLQQRGLGVHVLSGDQPASVAALLQRLQAPAAAHAAITWRALCTPQDKLDALQALQQQGRRVLMAGDGINDAPVLARADVSVAMGSAAALAQARADVVVLSNRIGDITALHAGAARCMRIVRQNLSWALAYNLACVPLALAGWLPPWAAGLGMAGSSLLVVLNALRLTRGAGSHEHSAASQAAPRHATAPTLTGEARPANAPAR